MKDVTYYDLIAGDFSEIRGQDPSQAIVSKDEKKPLVVLVASDGSVITKIATISFLPDRSDRVGLMYTAPPLAAKPSRIFIGRTSPDHVFLFQPVNATNPSGNIDDFHQLVTGDFCQGNGEGNSCTCTTTLLAVGNSCETATMRPGVTGYVYRPDGTGYIPVTVRAIDRRTADISFAAQQDFKPTWLVLANGGKSYSFAYSLEKPPQTSDLVYQSSKLESICVRKAGKPDCPETKETDVNIGPLTASDATVTFLGIQGDLLFVRVTAAPGDEPFALLVSSPKQSPSISTIARRVIKPGGTQSSLDISMTMMDQDTMKRNYGQRIAEEYLAVILDARNKTSTKLQFSKSALWFDVDYAEAEYHESRAEITRNDFAADTGEFFFPADVYSNSFRKKPEGREFRFGLEQNVKHAPYDYRAVLGSFDYTSEKLDRQLRNVELLGSVLTLISTGQIVAQVHNTAFRDAVVVLTGTFLPGFRSLIMNTQGTNRQRLNLVEQTLQDNVQVPAGGSVQTIVLLPREGILGLDSNSTPTGNHVPVIVDRVLDVHVDPDVINGPKGAPVPQNQLQNGYSKDQVRQALGEPSGVTTNPDGSSAFTFIKGTFQTVNFDANGSVVSWEARSLDDQLSQAQTMPAALDLLAANKIIPTKLSLLNGNTVLTDMPGVTHTLQFDPKGNHIADYQFLYDGIRSYVGQARKDFETYLASKQLPNPTNGVNPVCTSKTSCTYKMPDIEGGEILATFRADQKLEKIQFYGEKPASVQ